MLEEMEKKVSQIYSRASKEIEKKTADFWEAFEKQDKAMKAKLSAGKITQEQYEKWQKEQALTGTHAKAMQDVVAAEISNAAKTATAYVNGKLPNVYALNYNKLADDIGGLIKGYSFELVDAATVRNLATSNKTLLPYKKVNGKKVERWATQKVNSEIMQGVIQGESIPNIAKRLQNVTEMDKNSAIRNARTTVTSAENKGRQDSYIEAEADGIVLVKCWIATNDTRTREAHEELDGQEVDIDEPFVNSIGEIMYPGDPDAEPANVYNCRCSMKTRVIGFRKQDGSISYVGEH